MLKLRKTSYFFNKKESEEILRCIQEYEKNTSGEIRVFIESKCHYVDTYDRAKELFLNLQMDKTMNRNAVLVYIAYQHKEFAFCSDENFYRNTNKIFWDKLKSNLSENFRKGNKKEGLINCIHKIGNELSLYFPNNGERKNELPDEIIFGK